MINQFHTIASRIPEILNRISSATFANQSFDVTKPLPYHDNRLKLVVPLDRATDITITLTRTRAGKRINYNPDEIVPLKCDINMTKKIDEKHHAFPQFNRTTVNEAINRALHAQPVADSEYPTNFIF